jgi:hypothetical protein
MMQRPIFSAVEAQDRPEFYVLIRWADGAERRVNYFARREDAQRWIAAQAENWLRQRLGQPGFPQPADSTPSVAFAKSVVEDRRRAALALAA